MAQTKSRFKSKQGQTNSRVINIVDLKDRGLTDTQAFTTALSEGGDSARIVFPDGTYIMDSQITATNEKIFIEGAGIDVTTIISDVDPTFSMWSFGNANGPIKTSLVIKDMTIDLNNKAQSWGMQLMWYKDVLIENVKFINPSATMFSALFLGKFGAGSSDWEATDVVLKNCIFDYTGVTNSWEAVTLSYLRHVKLEHCTFIEKRGSFPAVTNYLSEDVTFTDCSFVNSTAVIVNGRGATTFNNGMFQDSYVKILAADNVSFTGGFFSSIIDQQAEGINGGIIIEGVRYEIGDPEIPFYVTAPYTWTCNKITVNGMTFKGSNAHHIQANPFSRNAITYLSANVLEIIGCTFDESYTEGLSVWAEELNITKNTFINSNTSGVGAAATHILGAAKKFTLEGNHFVDTAGTVTDDVRINRLTYTTQIPDQDLSVSGNSFGASAITYFDGANYITTPDANTVVTEWQNIGLPLVDGRILFGNASGGASQDSGFFYDYTNNYLGVGTEAPDTKAHIETAAAQVLKLQSTGSYPRLMFRAADANTVGVLERGNPSSTKDFYFGEVGDSGKWSFRGTGDTEFQGNVSITTAGKGLIIEDGANARIGTASLVGGTVTVANTSVTANTVIFVNVASAGGTQGILSYTTNPGVGFTVTSTNALDTSSIVWLLIELG